MGNGAVKISPKSEKEIDGPMYRAAFLGTTLFVHLTVPVSHNYKNTVKVLLFLLLSSVLPEPTIPLPPDKSLLKIDQYLFTPQQKRLFGFVISSALFNPAKKLTPCRACLRGCLRDSTNA